MPNATKLAATALGTRVLLALPAMLVNAMTRAAPPVAAVTAPQYVQAADGFVSAKGERALIMGYTSGLEVWAYPLQILRAYRLRFRLPGHVDSIDATTLLHHVERRPTEIVRVYIGSDFVVRERLFVPRAVAGAIVRYEVEGRPELNIEVNFEPSLDLMWPGALGGQTVEWDTTRSAYVEREPLHGFTATIASAETVGHDTTVNQAHLTQPGLALLLAPRPASGSARVTSLYIAADPPGTPAARSLAVTLRVEEEALREEAVAHSGTVLATSLQIVTPDVGINRAFASAVLALDQAWVCNTQVGCGVVAGYGPSRPGRRPQYAWFFAGDGLVAMRAMLDAGQHDRARQELEFIIKYQDQQTGMIWHEITQSAGLIDWQSKYPYMFVHVDITFQYLAGVQSYIAATGNKTFARRHWPSLAAAYRYCLSVVDPTTGLPRIPAGKQGQNEQDRMRDDFRLSSAWIDAADSFAALARVAGHAALAGDAERRAIHARNTLARDGWDVAHGFWLAGHTLSGEPIHSERSDAVGVLDQHVFSQASADIVLDRIASPEFLTDWGVRNLSANAPGYDPNLYGSGSVWAFGTSGVAATFWKQHRPLTAWSIWRSLSAWDTLDSAGHLHEVLAGDLFHPEFESVPEQSWSSAGLLSSAVQGLFGLEVDAVSHKLRLAPHLPAGWRDVTLRNVLVGAVLDVHIVRDTHSITIRVNNTGDDVAVDFAPMIPLGATLGAAAVEEVATPVQLETHAQDQHALIKFVARHGITNARVEYEGGVEIAAVDQPLAAGDASSSPKLVSAVVAGHLLTIDAWTSNDRAAVELFTPWQLDRAEGAAVEALPDGRYRVQFDQQTSGKTGYTRAHAVIRFR